MVRLKADMIAGVCIAYREFQFHYGTIKSLTQVQTDLQRSYFNSTMVRLKVFHHLASPASC